jgi:uncharacterized Zn-binding protein involved in type VI secretion
MFLFVVAVTTVAVPTSIAAVTLASGPAAASGGTLVCSKISGSGAGAITIKKCNDTVIINGKVKPDKANKTITGNGPSLVAGGTLTFEPSGQTIVVGGLSTTAVGQGACKTNWVEEDTTGSVVAGSTSPYVHTGDTFASRICVNKHLKVKLVADTTLAL